MEIITKNKKAFHKYFILEKFQAGISLKGSEVKAIKDRRISFEGSYVKIKNGEVFLVGAHIPPYQVKNVPLDYNPKRDRKLLLKKKEIRYLIGKTKQKGLTMTPLIVYNQKGKIKLEFGIVRQKGKKDKRRELREKAMEHDLRRELKNQQQH